MSDPPQQPHAEKPVDLKDPVLAALLAWLVPGLGHLYQHRLAKAVLYFVCIMGTFVYGLYLGSDEEIGWGRVVYASWRPTDKRLYYFCQIGVGAAAMPALVQSMRVRQGKPPLGHFMAPPRLDEPVGDSVTLDQVLRRIPRRFELGTVYTAIAGLLNLLAIFDAAAGPVVLPEKTDKKEAKTESEEEDEKDEKASEPEGDASE